jgi:UDP-N-acetylmuramyl pentapeptide phosphotransferase/UDP-N-acetylglucosamine-1-phosphate transferase
MIVLVALAAGILCAALITATMPWLRAYALARPNGRSSHMKPTPQGGGAAVVAATLAVAWGAVTLWGPGAATGAFAAVTAATLLLAVVGAVDDIRDLGPLPRLLLQAVAVGIVLAAMPAELRAAPFLPWWVERIALFVGFLWFVNLTNFMDGIDWMTVAETTPIAGAVVLFAALGFMPWLPALVALALLGAMLGVAPFNKPVARLFLGDVGSLPIGLLLAWLLLQLAVAGHLAAALILPLYYLADATVTLVRRLAAGEPFWEAHRSHFYQRALDNGFTVPAVIARVFALNLALAALALATIAVRGMPAALTASLAAVFLVALLLARFARGPR